MVPNVIEEDLRYIASNNMEWSGLEGKTVLVSGANGFLPSYMIDTIAYLNENAFKNKATIIALVRNLDNGMKRFENLLNKSYFKLLCHDVNLPITIDEDVNFIVHAASQASPRYYKTDPVGTLSANILGTYNLLEFSRKYKLDSFLFFSSGEVYGELSDEFIPTKEHYFGYINPTNVRSCYSESKRMGETMCISWLHQYGVPVKIVRPFHTYGPGMKLDDGRVFADFVADLHHKRDIIIKSDGKYKRTFCYLADATLAYFIILLRGEVGEAYNVGNENSEVSISELANRLVNIFPELGLNVIYRNRFQNDNYENSLISRNCPDISKIRSLGWEPKYTIEEGFKRTVLSYKL